MQFSRKKTKLKKNDCVSILNFLRPILPTFRTITGAVTEISLTHGRTQRTSGLDISPFGLRLGTNKHLKKKIIFGGSVSIPNNAIKDFFAKLFLGRPSNTIVYKKCNQCGQCSKCTTHTPLGW